jgi:lysophospholipase L1-like esterase
LYEFTVPGEAPGDIANGVSESSLRYDFNSFHPQVVVLFVGINDFQGNPPYAKHDAFKKAYAELLDKLRKAHPGVKFLLLSTKVWPNDDLTPTVKAIYDAQKAAGKSDLEFMTLTTANVGLLGHPDIHSHEDMAKAIRPLIGRLGRWLSR